MVNSRRLEDLRADVRRNVEIFLELCAAEGLNVLVTQTLRDDEYQESLYAKGRTEPGRIVTNSRRTSFHGRGLAFDICKNVKGREYSDAAFFARCGEIGKRVGFSWGGDFRSLPDRPHFQWDQRGQYSGAMVRAGRLPPTMPAYRMEESEMITVESINGMSDKAVLALVDKIQNVLGDQEQTGSLAAEFEQAIKDGITNGGNPKAFCTRAQAAVMDERLYNKLKEEMGHGV